MPSVNETLSVDDILGRHFPMLCKLDLRTFLLVMERGYPAYIQARVGVLNEENPSEFLLDEHGGVVTKEYEWRLERDGNPILGEMLLHELSEHITFPPAALEEATLVSISSTNIQPATVYYTWEALLQARGDSTIECRPCELVNQKVVKETD